MPDASSRPAGAFPAAAGSPTGSSCSSLSLASNPCKLIHHYVPHCRQHFNWDCGLTCVLMVLKADGAFNCDHQKLRELCPTTSIWTVDLAHLLRRFGFDVWFFTVTLGTNPDFVNESFYMANMKEDELRVSELFSAAEQAGIMLRQRSLSDLELRALLLFGDYLVILLLDRRRLDPALACEGGMLPNLSNPLEPAGYMGHYVLLIGFDSDAMEYVVRDPAACAPEQRISVQAIDQARRSFGTDEDLLVVSSAQIRARAASATDIQDCKEAAPDFADVSSLLSPQIG